MTFKWYTLFIGLIPFVLSCSERKMNGDAVILNLDENVQDSIYYSSFVDSISYIPLETTDDCLIGRIKDVIIADSFIFVLDSNPSVIYIFDCSGNYLRKIDRKGEGPGEYGSAYQFSYNRHRQSISVYSTLIYKVIEYDLYGNLINEFKLDYFIMDLHQFDNGDYLFTRSGLADDDQAVSLICDSTGLVKQQLLQRDKKYLIDSYDKWEILEFDNTLNFISPQLDNFIYSYSNDTLVNTFNFSLLPKPTKENYKHKNGGMGLETYYIRSRYVESRNWVHLVYWSAEKGLRNVLYNKRKGIYLLGRYLKNDIDSKENGWSLSGVENNTFTFYLQDEEGDLNPTIMILHLKND